MFARYDLAQASVWAVSALSLLVIQPAIAQQSPQLRQYRLPAPDQVAQKTELQLNPSQPVKLPPVAPATAENQAAASAAAEVVPPRKPTRLPTTTKAGFSVPAVLSAITSARIDPGEPVGSDQWWASYVQKSMRYSADKVPTGVDQLIQLALLNSAQLQVYSEVPRIRETAIIEADAVFDWTRFVSGIWDDTSNPVGNTLTVGGNGTRYNDHNLRVGRRTAPPESLRCRRGNRARIWLPEQQLHLLCSQQSRNIQNHLQLHATAVARAR